MRAVLRSRARFLFVVPVVLALTPVLFVTSGRTGSPYASALADPVWAAGPPHNCPNNLCDANGPKACKRAHGFYCVVSGSSCTNSKCL